MTISHIAWALVIPQLHSSPRINIEKGLQGSGLLCEEHTAFRQPLCSFHAALMQLSCSPYAARMQLPCCKSAVCLHRQAGQVAHQHAAQS